MHEFGVTEHIITKLIDQLKAEQVTKVTRVCFRRSSAFSEEVLRQSFSVLSRDTPLEGAELVVEVSVLNVSCPVCGHTSRVDSSDLVGHMFICPNCANVQEIAEAHDLELVTVTAETDHAAVS